MPVPVRACSIMLSPAWNTSSGSSTSLSSISSKWSYVTASPSHHDPAIPLLSPLLFMCVGHPYIPFFIHQYYISTHQLALWLYRQRIGLPTSCYACYYCTHKAVRKSYTSNSTLLASLRQILLGYSHHTCL